MNKDIYEFLFQLRSSGFQHHTPESVQNFLDQAKSNGGFPGFAILDGDRGSLSNNNLRDLRYYFIGCCFFAAQVLIENRVDTECAYGLSDYYINRMDSTNDRSCLQALLQEMMVHCAELVLEYNRPSYGATIDACIHYVDQQLYTTLSASDVAEHFQMNASYLSTLFREKTGLPLHKYILKRKLEEARKMLHYTDVSVGEISGSLGFSSTAHFSKAFRQETGISPSQFRQHG